MRESLRTLQDSSNARLISAKMPEYRLTALLEDKEFTLLRYAELLKISRTWATNYKSINLFGGKNITDMKFSYYTDESRTEKAVYKGKADRFIMDMNRQMRASKVPHWHFMIDDMKKVFRDYLAEFASTLIEEEDQQEKVLEEVIKVWLTKAPGRGWRWATQKRIRKTLAPKKPTTKRVPNPLPKKEMEEALTTSKFTKVAWDERVQGIENNELQLFLKQVGENYLENLEKSARAKDYTKYHQILADMYAFIVMTGKRKKIVSNDSINQYHTWTLKELLTWLKKLKVIQQRIAEGWALFVMEKMLTTLRPNKLENNI